MRTRVNNLRFGILNRTFVPFGVYRRVCDRHVANESSVKRLSALHCMLEARKIHEASVAALVFAAPMSVGADRSYPSPFAPIELKHSSKNRTHRE